MATATARTANASAQTELERRMLRRMLLIRRFEGNAAEACALGRLGGGWPVYSGEAGPPDRAPDAARRAHLPLHGTLDVGPAARRVSHQGGSRGAAQARPDRAAGAQAEGRRSAR